LPIMSRLPDNQFVPPESWEKFESLVQEVYREEWKDSNIQKNGRVGQPQKGVDVWGNENQIKPTDDISGIQCKEKDNYPQKKLTYKEVTDEVKKAKGFKPKLAKYYIATTARRDSTLDEKVRLFNEKQKKSGKLQVKIKYWEDILEAAKRHPKIVASYFGEQYDSGDIQHIKIAEEIAEARETLNKFAVDTAVKQLESIKTKYWTGLPNHLKFKVLSNLGVASGHRGKLQEAIDYFIEAYHLMPEEENAQTNLAWSYIYQDKKDEARKILDDVIAKHPSNVLAYTNLFNTYEELSLDDAIKLVPTHLLDSSEIASGLGDVAQSVGSSTEAKKYYETAIKNAKLPMQKFHAQTSEAEVIIQETRTQDVLGLRQLDQKKLNKLKAALKVMKQAWTDIKDTELAKYQLDLPSRLAHLQKVIGQVEESKQTAHEILRIDEFNKGANILLGLFATDEDNDKDAETYFLKAAKSGDADAQMLLAETQRDLGKHDLVTKNLLKLIKHLKETDSLRHVTVMLSGMYIRAGNLTEAESVVDKYLKEHPKDITLLVQKAHLQQAQGNEAEFKRLLQEIDPKVKDVSRDDLVVLADELYRAKLYDNALAIYEKIVDPSLNTEWTRKLLDCYYQSGDYKKALEIAAELRRKHGAIPFVTDLESYIYESIDDLDGAKSACEELLATYPDNKGIKIRLAIINFKAKNFNYLDAFLKDFRDYEGLNLEAVINLVTMYSERGFRDKARELLYEFRAENPNDPEIHSRYIGYFFLKENNTTDLLDFDKVEVDTVVTVKGQFGDEIYLIHAGETNIGERVLNTEAPIAKKLLGKSIGDEVELGGKNSHKVVVKEIKSKYIVALHKSQELFPSFFPDHDGIQKFSFDENNPEPAIEQMKKVANDRRKAVESVEDLYKQGKLTISLFASMVGKSTIEVFYGFQARELSSSINVFKGHSKELDEASKTISGKQLVVDITSLITMRELKIYDEVIKNFGKLGIVRSTVEEIEQHVSQLKDIAPDGYSTMSSINGNMVINEIPPEAIKQRIQEAEELLEFIQKNCEILQVKKALDIKAARLEELKRVLGKGSVDTILAASADNKMLYSEDLVLRQIAISEFSSSTIWTQPILINLRDNGQIDEEEYQKHIIELTKRGYSHTSFNAAILIKAAETAKWKLDEPLTNFFQVIEDKSIDIDSLIGIVVEFLYALWKNSSVEVSGRNVIVTNIVKRIASRGNAQADIARMQSVVSVRFRLWQTGAADLNQSLEVALKALE
jgi:tetratricopeptide (TPR) repeat protein